MEKLRHPMSSGYVDILFYDFRGMLYNNISNLLVMQVFYALSMVSISVSSWSAMTPDLSKVKTAMASVFAILDRKSEIDPSDELGITLETVDGEIEFKNVNFGYPTRREVQILKGLSLTIKGGKVTSSHIFHYHVFLLDLLKYLMSV